MKFLAGEFSKRGVQLCRGKSIRIIVTCVSWQGGKGKGPGAKKDPQGTFYMFASPLFLPTHHDGHGIIHRRLAESHRVKQRVASHVCKFEMSRA